MNNQRSEFMARYYVESSIPMEKVAETIASAFQLLGIQVPDRM